MKAPKKRSLNEIRQTKDVHYIVPKFPKENIDEQALDAFSNSTEETIKREYYMDFFSFLKKNGYKIIRV